MQSAQVASKDATPTVSVYKSLGDMSCVYVCAVKQVCVVCVSILQRGQYNEVYVFASTLCNYDLRTSNIFVLSWARVRRVCLGSFSSVVFIGGCGV